MSALNGPLSKSWLYGNLSYLMQQDDPAAIMEGHYEEFGPVYVYPAGILGDRIVIWDPLAIAHFLDRGTTGYILDAVSTKATESLFGAGLLTSLGDVHRRQRKALLPAFSSGAIRALVPTFFESARKLVVAWDELIENGGKDATIEVQDWMNRVALDAIGFGGFGHDFGGLNGGDDPVVFNAMNDIDWPSLIVLVAGTFLPWFSKIPTRYNSILSKLSTLMSRVAETLLERNRRGGPADSQAEDKSVIGLLVRAEEEASDPVTEPTSTEELKSHMNTLLLAGYETTAITLTWALIELALNLDVQENLREELAQFPGTDISWSQMNSSTPYLDGVVHEILRIHPAVMESTRMASEDDILPSSSPVTLKDGSSVDRLPVLKGQTVSVPIEAINRSTAFWGPDAKKLVPERWMSESADDLEKKGVKGYYKHLLTFSGGQRGCLGRAFVIAELKAVLSVLVKTYKFSLPKGKDTVFDKHVTILLRPKVKGEKGFSVPMLVSKVE